MGGFRKPIPCTWEGNQYPSLNAAALDNDIRVDIMQKYYHMGYTCFDDIVRFGKPCTWNGVQYPSIAEAARHLGIHKDALRWRLLQGYRGDEDMASRRAG